MTWTKDEIIRKARKIKAKADSAEAIGSETEAHAFAQKLFDLMAKHDLSMSDVEFQDMLDEESVDETALTDANFGDERRRRRRSKWRTMLCAIVAHAHDCKILVERDSSTLWIVGYPRDREIAKEGCVVLCRAMEEIAEREYHKFFYRSKRLGVVERARGFKSSFIIGFITRLAERYEEIQKSHREESTTALVRLRQKRSDVDAYLTTRAVKMNKRGGYDQRIKNLHGFQRGMGVASDAPLRPGEQNKLT